MTENYDLIIVGAGPAGLALAKELADSNLKILLLDKKKNAKDVKYTTLGSLINPDEWDLPKSILNPINECYVASSNEYIIKKGQAHIINRGKLLEFLEKEAKKNTNLKISYNSDVNKVDVKNDNIIGVTYNNIKASARLYVDCSGVGCVLGKKVGLNVDYTLGTAVEYHVPLLKEQHTVDLFFGPDFGGGYGWIFPLDSKTAIVGFGAIKKEYYSKVESYLKGMWNLKRVQERCKFKPLERHVGITRFRHVTKLNKFVKNNVILIGDTALQAHPIVCEGVRFVMDSARIASKWIMGSMKLDDLDILHEYEKEWKNKYYHKYKLALQLQQYMLKFTNDHKKTDNAIKRINNISDEDFVRILEGDLNYRFLCRIGIKFFLNI